MISSRIPCDHAIAFVEIQAEINIEGTVIIIRMIVYFKDKCVLPVATANPPCGLARQTPIPHRVKIIRRVEASLNEGPYKIVIMDGLNITIKDNRGISIVLTIFIIWR